MQARRIPDARRAPIMPRRRQRPGLTLLTAPRALKEPVCCSLSSFRKVLRGREAARMHGTAGGAGKGWGWLRAPAIVKECPNNGRSLASAEP